MKRAATFFGALTLGVFAMLGTDSLSAYAVIDDPTTQQQDDILGGEISHYFPDTGYDPKMPILCGKERIPVDKWYLAEGESSRGIGFCDDAQKVWVYKGSDIYCKYGMAGAYQWKRKFARSRWRRIANQFNDGLGCTYRKQ